MDEEGIRKRGRVAAFEARLHSALEKGAMSFHVPGMKAVILAGIFLVAPFAVLANDPAYTALRVMGKGRGEDTLKHIVELRGKNGMPQPPVWKIVLDDPRARGGIRELEVQNGKVIGERTPLEHDAVSPMVLTQLNLDSEGAFTVANQEAQKLNLSFDHVDYVLQSGSGNGTPVWKLDLSDSKGGHVGAIVIAADTGNILHQDFDHGSVASRQDNDRAEAADRADGPPPVTGPPSVSGDPGFSEHGEPIKSLPDFFHRVQKHFERRGRQLENFFTGKKSSPDEHPPED